MNNVSIFKSNNVILRNKRKAKDVGRKADRDVRRHSGESSRADSLNNASRTDRPTDFRRKNVIWRTPRDCRAEGTLGLGTDYGGDPKVPEQYVSGFVFEI